AIDVDAAWTSELFPLIDELPILIEYLDAAVAAVRDENAAARVDRDAVRRIEFTWSRSTLAPRLDELAVLRELHDAIHRDVGDVAIGDEDVAVLRDGDVAWPAEDIVAAAGNASLAERHQQLAVGAELEDLVALAVLDLRIGHPDISLTVDRHALRVHDQPIAETRNDTTPWVESHNQR